MKKNEGILYHKKMRI